MFEQLTPDGDPPCRGARWCPSCRQWEDRAARTPAVSLWDGGHSTDGASTHTEGGGASTRCDRGSARSLRPDAGAREVADAIDGAAMSDRRRGPRSEAHRLHLSEAAKATWARKRRGDRLVVQRVTRPFSSIYEECLNALLVRAGQFDRVATCLRTLSDGEDSFAELAGISEQVALHARLTQQALAIVIQDHHRLIG
jgi:hypothetical protein